MFTKYFGISYEFQVIEIARDENLEWNKKVAKNRGLLYSVLPIQRIKRQQLVTSVS